MKHWVIALAAAVLLTSCSNPVFESLSSTPSEGASVSESSEASEPSVPRPEDVRTFALWLDDTHQIVNTNGEMILQDPNAELLYDMATSRPQYIVRYRYEKLAEDADGWITDSRTWADIYDLNGNLLLEGLDLSYTNLFGECLYGWGNDGSEKLLKLPSGESLTDKDISYVSAIGSDFLMLYGTNGEAIGFADPHGNITETSGLALSSVSESGYYISTDPATGKFGLLDSSLGEIFPTEYESINVIGDYAFLWDGNISRAITLPEMKEAFSIEGWVLNYFDGEVGVVRNYDTLESRLVDADGNFLTEDSWSYIDYSRLPYPADVFCAYNSDGCALLARDGSILLQKKNGSISPLGDGVYSLSWYDIVDGENVSYSQAIDAQGNIIVPAGRYDWLTICYNLLEPLPLFTGTYQTGQGNYRTDVLNLEGNIILSGLKNLYQTDGEYFAVEKGFSAGILDREGNWLYQTSTFQTFGDD